MSMPNLQTEERHIGTLGLQSPFYLIFNMAVFFSLFLKKTLHLLGLLEVVHEFKKESIFSHFSGKEQI